MPTNSYPWQLSELPFELEKNLRADPEAFLDPEGFRIAMLKAEPCICRIELPELTPCGTGFLVAPDLLITNDHVRTDSPNGGKWRFESNPRDVRFRFGFAEQTRISTRTYELHPTEWLVANSPEKELDFCLIRLSEPAGQDRIAESPKAPLRGWILLEASEAVENQSLFILQHPLGDSLKVSAGHMSSSSPDWIDYHVNTEHGSSGSPVFDCAWRCVALHSRAGTRRNRGVRIGAILACLSAGVRAELEVAPPAPSEPESLAPAAQTMMPAGGLSVDLSCFSAPAIQAVGRSLLKVAASHTGPSIPEFEVAVGGGKRVRCTPSEVAGDVMHRQALQGDLQLLETRIQVLQYHQGNYQVDPMSPTVWPILIQRTLDDIDSSIRAIADRLEVMIDEFRYTRNV